MDPCFATVKLRWMDGEGANSSPRQMLEHFLPDDEKTTQVFKDDETRLSGFRLQNDQNQNQKDVIARIYRRGWSVILEPRVQEVNVKANFFGKQSETQTSPVPVGCNPYYQRINYVFLRPDDVVDFPQHHLIFEIASAGDETPKSDTAEKLTNGPYSEVQVKSSNNEPEVITAADVSDTDGDDSDLDRTISPHSVRTPAAVESTPATSRPTAPTIKETPQHKIDDPGTNEEEALFSTARDVFSLGDAGVLDDDQNPIADVESPSFKAQQRSNDSQIRTGNESFPRGGSRISQNTDLHDELEPRLTEVQHDNLPTSDIIGEHEIFTMAAVRTMTRKVPKRKSSDGDDEYDTEASSASKKRKLDIAYYGSEAPVQSEEDREEEPRPPHKLQPKDVNGKVRRAALSQTQESTDEIAVAVKKSSPDVLIKRTRAASSATPSSSATSAMVSKILLSSDSAIRKDNALKNWLKRMGVAIIDNGPSKATSFVCVVPKNHSLKSAKVLHSLTMGQLVVTDEWLTESKAAEELLDPGTFVHKALEESEAQDRSKLYSGMHLFFTNPVVSNYKDGWHDICEVAKEAGAIEIDKVSFSRPSSLRNDDKIIFFGGEKGDNDVSRLIHEYGRTVYSKELFTNSIISGQLDLEDNRYKLKASMPAKKSRRS